MGLLDSVERGIEKVVRNAFATGSKAQVQPVEIANRLRRALDNSAYTISQGRALVPNVFDVELSTPDFERAQVWGEGLADELCDVVIKHVNSQRYTLQGPVRVTFKHDDALKPGVFEVTSSTEKAGAAAAAPGTVGAAREAPTRAPSVPAAPRAVPRTQPVLIIGERRYAINDSPVVLGRSSEADILIDDTGVSRKHLEIQLQGDRAWAVDLGSTNGSHVNGERLQGRAELFDGSTISMGRTKITFRRLPLKDGNS